MNINKILLLPLALAVAGLLSGCGEDDKVAKAEAAGPLDLATFLAWPVIADHDEVITNPEAYGQDNLVIVVDRSGSMEGICGEASKAATTVEVLKSFIPNIPSTVAVGYIEFDRNSRVVVPLELNNQAALLSAVGDYRADGGSTYLGEAIGEAFTVLSDQALTQASTGTYRIVVITDGAASDERALKSILLTTGTTPVEVMTAGFCMGDHVLNDPGQTIYVEATNADELLALLTDAVSMESLSFDSASFTTGN